ncbi:MAG: carbohydrate kinase [Actinomycetota bacterium]|nr:carbohydrate kinase [Actinomycetota bacterium]
MSVIGVDLGTSRVKAVRYDADWNEADSCAEDSVVNRPAPGHSEQDMDQVWAALVRVLRTVVDRCPDGIDLIAVTAQGDGCWLIDDAGEPAGPALLWNDARATSLVDAWEADGTLARAFDINGCFGFAGVASSELRWLKENSPEVLTRASTLLSCGGWGYFKLTGHRAVDDSEAANSFFDTRTRQYDDRILDLYGIADLKRLMPQAVHGRDRVAPLLGAVAHEVGLKEGTPVVVAPYDVVSMAVGSGAHRVGDAFAVLGTTLCNGLVSDDPRMDRPGNGMSLPAPDEGNWVLTYPTMVGTEVLDWTQRLLGLDHPGDVIRLADEADRSRAPMVLPYLSTAGERSPFLNPRARGAILGLDVTHTRAEVAAGIVDGLSMAVKDCVASAGAATMVAISGGGARSTSWCQVISDAVGVPVTMPDVEEIGARGAALLGAYEVGHFASLHDAVSAAVRPRKVLQPDPERTRVMAGRYEKFLQMRDKVFS